jgi:hypothetical protein
VAPVFLNGNVVNGGATCNGAFACTINGALSTSYDAWQLNGKAAYDWKYGAVTVTPSAAPFGGTAGAKQTLSQSLSQFPAGGGALLGTVAYTANTSLRWTDVGGRFGLDIADPMTSALTVRVGGWIGVAGRSTSFTGIDSAISPGNFTGTGAIAISESRTVFLANAEAGFAYRYTPAVALRGFAGVSYDDSVPGITNPSFTGPNFVVASTTPARLYYQRETSYYAGGGLHVRFGGPVGP